jgi:hypothetical protein
MHGAKKIPEPGAAESAKQILYGLIGALKKLNLYSEKHSVYRTALGILKKLFDEHFDRFGNFRIHIERNKIVYQDEALCEGGVEPTELVSLLHRDGILWLEFQRGLGIWEIDFFYKILRDHSTLDEDPEDDIVTALWAANLPSIMYEAADLELGLPDDIDFAVLPCHDHQIADSEQKDREPIQCQTIYNNPADPKMLTFFVRALSLGAILILSLEFRESERDKPLSSSQTIGWQTAWPVPRLLL